MYLIILEIIKHITGTFQGWSLWASNCFERVISIEYSHEIYAETKTKFSYLSNVEFIFGDSRLELEKIIKHLEEPCIFWLDAHWCNLDSYGENDQCPLIKEIEVLNQTDKMNIILIDDARLFLVPPPQPNSIEHYPDMALIIKNLIEPVKRNIFIYEDVIIAIPNELNQKFKEYLQVKTTNDHVLYAKKQKKLNKVRMAKRKIKKIIGYKYFTK